MANAFDSMESNLFRTTTNVFGYDASWIPSGSTDGAPLTAVVHLKDPNKLGDKYEHERVDFKVKQPVMEYFEPAFPGLMESVETTGGGAQEIVSINVSTNSTPVLKQFYVTEVTKIWDGKTYLAILIPV